MARTKKQKTEIQILEEIENILFNDSVKISELESYGFKLDKDNKIQSLAKSNGTKTKKSDTTTEEAKKKLQEIKKILEGSDGRISLEEIKKQGYQLILNSDGSIKKVSC
jgi:hypothetical protein